MVTKIKLPTNFKERILFLLLGLILVSIGTSFSMTANLGQSSVSAFSKNIEFLTTIKAGTTISLINYLCFVLQIILLKKDFKPIQCLQLVLTSAFGILVNFFSYNFVPTASINPDTYALKMIILLVGLLLSTLGVSLMIKANLIFLPFEGFCNTLVVKSRKPFSTVRPILDGSIVLVSILLIIVFKIPNTTIREGTIIFTFLFGGLVSIFTKYLDKKSFL